MQKAFLKFVVFELVERIARLRLLLNECADTLHERSPGLHQTLLRETETLEEELLSHKALLNRLFSDGNTQAGKQGGFGLDPALAGIYQRLGQLSKFLLQLKQIDIEPETYLFLKDALPAELTKQSGEQTVLLVAEGESQADTLTLPNVLIDELSILNKNNPLSWVTLTRGYTRHLLNSSSALESLKLELTKGKKAKTNEALVEELILHALNLRIQGPAYYFYSLVEAVFAGAIGEESQTEKFLRFIEPALFYGLNHQNFSHKSLVIMHEACEKAKGASEETLVPLAEDVLSDLFRTVEKVVPTRVAFAEKNLERAIQLQERISQGVLLASTPVYPVEEVAGVFEEKQDTAEFSIYELLSMMTEYPHTPREIVNAGWLHKVERGPVWLYSTLNEERGEGYGRITDLIDYQDHLLRKSIETSEVHRVLLCST